MSWYDVFSHGYDMALERLYRKARTAAFARLDAERGGQVVDLACGTGANFPHLLERLGPERARIVGVDASAGMLRQAKGRIEKLGGARISLVEHDARTVGLTELEAAGGSGFRPDLVVCSLGFTTFPDWEQVFASSFAWLRPGGQYWIFDVHAERWVPQKTSVEWLARADLSRRVWEPLEKASIDFERTPIPGSPHLFGGRLFVATGTKPA